MSWEPSLEGGRYAVALGGGSTGLSLAGDSAQLYLGCIEQLDGRRIPDMGTESDDQIIAGFPRWSSVMTVQEYYRYPEIERTRYTCVVCGYPGLHDSPVDPGGRHDVSLPGVRFSFQPHRHRPALHLRTMA